MLSRALPRVGPSGGGTPPRPRSGSWRACGSGSSSNTRSRDLGLESAAGAAHDQGRGVSSGRGTGSDSGSVVGRRQHWKTGATVVPTTTRVYRLWRLSTSTVCFCDQFDVLRDALLSVDCQTVCLGVGLCYGPKQCRMLGHLGLGCIVLTAY